MAVSSCCVVSLEKGLKGMCAPSKYYSYLQAGKPIIAIVEEGSYLAQEIKMEKMGRVGSVGDVNSLSEAILSLSGNPAECKVFGERASALHEREYVIDIGLCKYAKMIKSTRIEGLE